MKYRLNYNGTLGEFIKEYREASKISSRELAKLVGKSSAYVSQIENGRNKNPDYNVLFNIFKTIGVQLDRIEDYLDSFGFMSPERERAMIQEALYKQNMSMEEYEEIQKHEEEFWQNYDEERANDPDYQIQKAIDELNNNNSEPSNTSSDGNDLLKDIVKGDINRINQQLYDIAFDQKGKGFNFVRNIGSTINDMSKNKLLFSFMLKFFDNDLSVLDEKGMLNVINTLFEEMNRCTREKSAWGVRPSDIKKPISKL